MRLKPLRISSVKIHLILLFYLCTLYGRTDSKSENKTDDSHQTKHNIRNKTINKITDIWFEKWLPYLQENSSELPLEAFIHGHNIANFAGFGISKPKPWRKDDEKTKLLNFNAEIVVNPTKPGKGPLPSVKSRVTSPAMSLISQKGCGQSDVGVARIVNGKDAQQGAYPWMAAILKGGDAWCGGSIINKNWVLTAGHCFMNDINPKLYAIRVGTIDRNRGTTYKVDKVIIHERFHLDNMFNSDIAMIHVNRPIKMGKLVKPVCIPKKSYEDIKTDHLLVVGWGQISYENKDLPTTLQEVILNTIKLTECAKKYKTKGNKIYFSQLCTWNKGQDACQGDSGAPAVEYHSDVAYLVGIVSYGSTCADEMPGVYTKVSFFLDWILRTLEREEGLQSESSEEEEET